LIDGNERKFPFSNRFRFYWGYKISIRLLIKRLQQYKWKICAQKARFPPKCSSRQVAAFFIPHGLFLPAWGAHSTRLHFLFFPSSRHKKKARYKKNTWRVYPDKANQLALKPFLYLLKGIQISMKSIHPLLYVSNHFPLYGNRIAWELHACNASLEKGRVQFNIGSVNTAAHARRTHFKESKINKNVMRDKIIVRK
jgi:hypothetical protein